MSLLRVNATAVFYMLIYTKSFSPPLITYQSQQMYTNTNIYNSQQQTLFLTHDISFVENNNKVIKIVHSMFFGLFWGKRILENLLLLNFYNSASNTTNKILFTWASFQTTTGTCNFVFFYIHKNLTFVIPHLVGAITSGVERIEIVSLRKGGTTTL